MQSEEIAQANLERRIRQNPYPGRGLVVGRSSAQDAWLMIDLDHGPQREQPQSQVRGRGRNPYRTEPVERPPAVRTPA